MCEATVCNNVSKVMPQGT